ncbi:MAG: N-acetylglucosamine-6-phosphate deacetylase [Oscillospiraceae bacterium]|jgi:N-acetylglucosamine-6-phosphate deacetylase|nr:N-acetylglucosamine-6-phosphate deacetylase [Oscillospiraceae bacterium]MCI8720189.1 N-acetylglucosamine-6-phosphate deacetylase [Oscillospiraceae bacterium]MCI8941652.1 N-acetylglucosamine-6-phosphate deacetylase [Oscillospiraceae bacterium]
MLIKNAKILIGKAFLEADIQFDETITAIGKIEGPADLDAQGCYVVPGLVDIHTHGAMGEDFSDGRRSGLQPLADYYAAHGVTSYLATTMTLKEETLTPAMHAIRDFRPAGGAKCAGVHLEGPFLSYAKRGAQAAENLHKPDAGLFHRLNEASGGQVKLVTVACEEEGALPFIREISQVCTVSLGHTTADYDTAMAGFAAGASHATHLYNGMPSFLHRAPGVIGAAFDAEASVELICDGLHIHPAAIRATYQLFGDKLNLISDSLRCAGMPDGDYELGGQPIVVKNHRATLLDGTLAGSSISLLDAVRNVVRFGLPLADAVYAASTAPALAVGLKAGALQAGRPADLLVLDGHLALKAVFVDGKKQG